MPPSVIKMKFFVYLHAYSTAQRQIIQVSKSNEIEQQQQKKHTHKAKRKQRVLFRQQPFNYCNHANPDAVRIYLYLHNAEYNYYFNY